MNLLNNLAITIAQIGVAASAFAAVPTIEQVRNYKYEFLKPGAVAFCSDVKPRVLSVGVLTRTDCCGRNGVDSVFQGGEGNRAQIENILRGYPFKNHKYGERFTEVVALPALLMEQFSDQEAVVSVCMSKFDLMSVELRGGTRLTFDLGYKVYVTFNSVWGRKSVLVQELEGETGEISAPFLNMYYNGAIQNRPYHLVIYTWPKIMEILPGLLRPVRNAEATQGLSIIKNEINLDFEMP